MYHYTIQIKKSVYHFHAEEDFKKALNSNELLELAKNKKEMELVNLVRENFDYKKASAIQTSHVYYQPEFLEKLADVTNLIIEVIAIDTITLEIRKWCFLPGHTTDTYTITVERD